MAEIHIPEIRPGDTPEEKINALYDAYFMMRKWLTYAFSGVLDEGNVLRAQEAVIANLLAGKITADQIDVTEGKIQAAQIEELAVGSNVQMGPNATISWDKVTGHPAIPSQYTDAQALNAWKNSGYATYINSSGVYSGSFNGGMFNVNPTGSETLQSGITIGGFYESGWHGQALQIKYEPHADGFPGTVFSSDGGVDIFFDTPTNFRNYTRFYSTVDFSSATVTGLSNVIAKFG